MTALLPHKEISVELRSNGVLGVLADGQPADAPYRDGILKAANLASVALKYKDIIKMKRAERSALVKGMEVVYIYHDKIDETSYTDETEVFNSCDDAISELKNMVRIIVNEFSGTRIFITSDHGFIYTYKPLTEDVVTRRFFEKRKWEDMTRIFHYSRSTLIRIYRKGIQDMENTRLMMHFGLKIVKK